MLISCPECWKEISDKAFVCPQCGYPLKPKETPRKSTRHKRLPNGFGQISFVKGNLRRPYRAMVTVGKTEYGKPVCKLLKPISYFETYNEAYEALVAHNRTPYEEDKDLTLRELHKKWFVEYKETDGTNLKTLGVAWINCTRLYDSHVQNITPHMLKEMIIEDLPNAYAMRAAKNLLNKMFDYAVEYGIVEKNTARAFNLPKNISQKYTTVKKEHIPYTDEEMNILWANADNDFVQMVLIQCYMGWRPQELCELRTENINLEEGWIRGGMKTKAGTNRVVPIHEKIKGMVESAYDANEEKLFPGWNFNKFAYRYHKVMESLNISEDHRPHDGRKHFVTQCKKYLVDEYAIKYMAGHAIKDITENIYTQRSVEWLASELSKIS